MVPIIQWPFALLGWSGSSLYLRMMRQYANKSQNKTLTSHGLWCQQKQSSIIAKTEEEIFEYIGLFYKKPELRNY